ncbi:hypothetical protein JTB14_011229 [Gonioctena quinquepunctata]|nr:hypothetical protein JTB14_011229 [Gonioctena quinquepunctata]
MEPATLVHRNCSSSQGTILTGSGNLLLVPWDKTDWFQELAAGNCSSSQGTTLTGSGNLLLLLELVWDQTGCFKEFAAGPWDQRD